jgi:hypothetical protein
MGLSPPSEPRGDSLQERARAEIEALRLETRRVAVQQGLDPDQIERELQKELATKQRAREKASKRLHLVRGEPLEVQLWKRSQRLADIGIREAREDARRRRPAAMKMPAAGRRGCAGRNRRAPGAKPVRRRGSRRTTSRARSPGGDGDPEGEHDLRTVTA